jgi:glycine/D-amino acid oxidase-like deaminating enzyme
MRIAIVGAGIAGALLALRLRQASPRAVVELVAGDRPADADATGASGGLVRGFEPDVPSCRLAAESLAEIRGDAVLRGWAGYREIGSVYLLPPGADPAEPVRIVDEMLPGSASVVALEGLNRRYPFRGLPDGTVGVVERHAGHIAPARLRAAVLAHLAAMGIGIRRCAVDVVTAQAGVRTADGTTRRYDAVVIAAGAWTPRLLVASGLAAVDLRTRQIQYTVHPAAPRGLGAFVDETSGLYGRPTADGAFLLGLPSSRWDVDPASVVPDPALAEEVLSHAHRRLGVAASAGPTTRTVASFDCYHDPPGLSLRPCLARSAVFTFTGGSGAAAKTVVAASRKAAASLLGL